VKLRFFGCGKFGWLASEAEDRVLTSKEELFMSRHRTVCRECAASEEDSSLALNMLREAKLEVEPAERSFDTRLIRRLRVQSVRMGMQYWSPAVFGAAIAAVALISALQMLARTHELPVFKTGQSEARRIHVGTPEFPEIPIADRIPEIP
jgi:hypothetical protein